MAQRGVAARLRRWAARLSYYEKWMILAPIIGAASGLFAVGFFLLLERTAGFFSWLLGAARCCEPVHDVSVALLEAGVRPPYLPLILAIGAGLGGLLVYTYAPEAEGHGTDAAIDAFHRRAGLVRLRVPFIKAAASALTIGSGGSGGVEGPSAQMGSGIGSWLAEVLHLSVSDRRIALASGIAGALSALFRSPLGTSFFAVEVLYKRDLEAPALVPAFLSSVTAYAVTAPIVGYGGIVPRLEVAPPLLYKASSLASYILLGLYLAPFAVLYVKAFYGAKSLFDSLERRGMTPYLKPVLGGIGAGLIGLALPHVLGSGRGLLPASIEAVRAGGGFEVFGLPLWASLAVIAVAKIAATSLSIGSGGSGGVFAPGIMAGALLGGSFGVLIGSRLTPLPPEVHAYIGMAAFFGAAAKVPLASSLMAAEMGRNYYLIVPTLMTAIIAREASGDDSLYRSQLVRRLRLGVVSASALLTMVKAMGVRAEIPLKRLVDVSYAAVTMRTRLIEVVNHMLAERRRLVVVVDDEHRPVGVVDADDLEVLLEAVGRKPDLPVGYVPLKRPPILHEDETIERALDEMVRRGLDYVIVVDAEGRYKGVVTVEEIDAALASLYLAPLPARPTPKS